MSNFPCHFCLVSRDDLANVNLLPSDIELRTHEEMRQFFDNSDEKLVSIETVPNFFWNLP